MKLNKKIYLLLLVCAIIGIGLGGYTWHTIRQASQNQALSGELSARAREFVTKDSSQGTGLWSEFDVTTASDSVPMPTESTISTPCFQLHLPFKTTDHTTETLLNKCVFRAKMVAPMGYLVISSYKMPDPQADTGIVLRRSKPDLYTEQSLTHQKWNKVLRFTSDEGIVFFAWKNDLLLTIAFNAVAKPQDFPNSIAEKILDGNVIRSASSSATTTDTQP